MAALASFAISVLLVLAMAGHSSGAAWCVCKDGVDEKVLQKTIDYACGNGADCNPTKQSGGCFNPNSVKAHCSYAVNSFFQKKNQGPGTCDFAGTATISQSDPSTAGCSYPASASAAGTSTSTPVGNTPSGGTTTVSPGAGTGTGSGMGGSTGTSPLITTPTGSGSGMGGLNNNGGLGPSGSGGMNTDNDGSSVAENRPMMVALSSFTAFLLLFWWA